MYNLIIDANKSSYIDGFLDRGVNAQQISDELIRGLESNQSWFLKDISASAAINKG
ncbi:MAG: DUF3871 family protein [Saprospiraceae bacterium]|nr:DUF3871 family protein [Saprospiraceae bacterium]